MPKQDRFAATLYKIAESRQTETPIDKDILKEYVKALVDDIPGLYKNPRLVSIAGEAIIIRADKDSHDVAIKICLPVRVVSSWDKYKKIAGFKPKTKFEEVDEIRKRFWRSINLQKQMHQILSIEQLFGTAYIPKVLEQHKSPRLCCVMEYVEAVPLIKHCINPQTAEKDVLELFEKILVVFEKCFHGRGIIHTDIKPANFLIVQRSNMPVILDFGIAKNKENDDELTSVNTQNLASNMWATSRQRRFPRLRSYYEDVFSLGLMFHSMFTKEVPQLHIQRDLVNTYDLFPPDLLPKEFQEFFLKSTNERDEKNKFEDISQMLIFYKKCCNEYIKNQKSVTIEGNTVYQVNEKEKYNSLEICKYVTPKYRKAIYYLLEGFNEL